MEVFIRDVPEQVNERALRNGLQPYMRRLSIEIFSCQKPRQKPFAFLLFLDANDGTRFLQEFGAVKSPRQPSGTPPKIQILNTPIYCERSKKSPNQHMLRNLEKEKDDKRTRTRTVVLPENLQQTRKKDFSLSSVSCGIWSYAGPDVVYMSCSTFNVNGNAKFGLRSLLVRLDSGKSIEFWYSGMYGITVEAAPRPSITIEVSRAPMFYEEVSESIEWLISRVANLSVRNQKERQRRLRVPSLSPEHAPIAGTCFVYRILLSQSLSGSEHAANQSLEAQMRALQKIAGLPPINNQQIDDHRPKRSFTGDLAALENFLASSTDLPWKIKYQIRSLVSGGFLTPSQTIDMLPEFKRMCTRSDIDICVFAIQKFRNRIPYAGIETDSENLGLESLTKMLRDAEAQYLSDQAWLSSEGLQKPHRDDVAMIHHVTITPAGTYLEGPDMEPMNRVLRKYLNHHEYFFRVQFADEDGEPVRYNPQISNEFTYNERFKSVLRNGITIAGRKHDFLGFSHSSLRAQSCWFMAPFVHNGSLLFDRQLIKKLGDFTKFRCPAKCAARIGQAFSETPIAVTFPPETFRIIEDVERNGRVFSDGVGTMSTSVMQAFWKAVPSMRDLRPTCFQIRFQGAKGMLSLDTRLKGDSVRLRPSMIKFEGSTAMDIELCGSNLRPLPMYLNRQVIKILEDMGVKNDWFLDLQSQEVERLRKITSSASHAAKFLASQSIGEPGHLSWFIKKLAVLGLEFRSDRFLRDVLETAVMMQVRVMKYKARIPVPEGITLFGILDETGFLEEGQIYCTFTKDGRKTVLLGDPIIITRAPALHPGDVQIAKAVLVPEDSPLRDLTNCICFSQKGDRDLPSKLSGGDLDGDLYNVIWDDKCQPRFCCKPADYPRQEPQDIGRAVEREDMTDFFVKFMETDQLGRIATSHQVLADQREGGTADPDCKLLAELHSTAVDFSKTGNPVNMKLMPKVIPARPDFMAPGPNIKIENKGLLLEDPDTLQDDDDDDEQDFTPYKYYRSKKALGILFRAVDEHDIFRELHQYRMVSLDNSSLLEDLWRYVSNKTLLIQWHQHVPEAQDLRDMHEDYVLNLMRRNGENPSRPITELEAFIGNILGTQGFQSRRQRDASIPLKEEFDSNVRDQVRYIRGTKNDDEHTEETLARSIACFNVSLGQVTRAPLGGRRTEPLVSFRYIAAAVCLWEMDKVLE